MEELAEVAVNLEELRRLRQTTSNMSLVQTKSALGSNRTSTKGTVVPLKVTKREIVQALKKYIYRW